MLIIITGLPGSGKTTLAKALAESLHAVHLNTDIIRSHLGKRGQYDEASKSSIYAKMLKQTESHLHRGETVIVDATFYRNAVRKPYRILSKRYRKKLFWIMVTAAEENIKNRICKKREHSEADFDVYLAIKEAFEPLEQGHLILHSDTLSVDQMVEKAREYILLEPFKMA